MVYVVYVEYVVYVVYVVRCGRGARCVYYIYIFKTALHIIMYMCYIFDAIRLVRVLRRYGGVAL